MNGIVNHSIPSLGYYRKIFIAIKNTVIDTVSHSVNEEGSAGKFFAAIIAFIVKAYIPETILALAFYKCVTHGLKVFNVIGTMGIIGRQVLKGSYESSYYPAVNA